MKRKTVTTIAALFCAAAASQAANLHLDLNGTAAGFGLDSSISPYVLNFTNELWNTDPTGGGGGSFVAPGSNDVLNFGLEGSGSVNFNWENYEGLVVGGINTYRINPTDTIQIGRFQKAGGGPETFTWGSNAVWNCGHVNNGMYWDLGSVGDFTYIGPNRLQLEGNFAKINGTCTIQSNAQVSVLSFNNLNTSSHLNIADGVGIQFNQNFDDSGPVTLSMGNITAENALITANGNANQLTISTLGLDLANDSPTNVVQMGWGISLAFAAGSSNIFDIAKTGGSTYADSVFSDWGKSATLGGTLKVNLLPGSDPLADGDTFELFQNVPVGSFDAEDLPALPAGLYWSLLNLDVNGTIQVVSPPDGPPADPTGLAVVTTGVYTVSLAWDDNTDVDLAGYKVYRAETSDTNDLVEIAELGLTSEYVDSTANPNDTTYYYSVTAFDVNTNVSGFSEQANATLAFALANGDFETPALSSGGISIDSSDHWTQVGSQQGIQKAGWASEPEIADEQGAWLKGWNKSVTNSFYQDKDAVPGIEYTLDAGFKIQDNFRANGGQIEMSLVWLDGGSTEISRNTRDVDAEISTNGWAHTDLTGTAPGGTAYVRALFHWTTTTNAGTGSGNQSAMVDNVSLIKGGAGDLYAAWAQTYNLSGSPDADPDYDYEGDGMDNLLEYALDGDPTFDDAADKLPVFSEDGSWFYYVHNERTDDSSLTYTVKRKGNLVVETEWVTNGVDFVDASAVSNSFKSVTNRTDIGDAEFLRLEVQQD